MMTHDLPVNNILELLDDCVHLASSPGAVTETSRPMIYGTAVPSSGVELDASFEIETKDTRSDLGVNRFD